MRRGFWETVYSSFKKAYNGVVGGVGVLTTIVFYFLAFQDNSPARITLGIGTLIATLLLVLLLTFADAAYEFHKRGPSALPKVRQGMDPFPGTSAALNCLTDPSELFYQGSWVSFWRVTQQQAQTPMGLGAVENVQEDGLILMQMLHVAQGQEDFAQKVRENNAEALSALRVKPYVPRQVFSLLEERP